MLPESKNSQLEFSEAMPPLPTMEMREAIPLHSHAPFGQRKAGQTLSQFANR